jgi:hypothetical protein
VRLSEARQPALVIKVRLTGDALPMAKLPMPVPGIVTLAPVRVRGVPAPSLYCQMKVPEELAVPCKGMLEPTQARTSEPADTNIWLGSVRSTKRVVSRRN